MITRFGFIPVAPRVLLSEEALNQLIADYIPAFEKLGSERWQAQMLGNPAPLSIFVATGGTDKEILNLRAERSRIAPTLASSSLTLKALVI